MMTTTEHHRVICGDALDELKKLPNESVDSVFTCPSPVFYCTAEESDAYPNLVGAERSIAKYINHLVEIFGEMHRVLKFEGSMFIVMGDYHFDGKLFAVPERFLISMTDRKWVYRNTLVWHRPNESRDMEEDNRFRRDWERIYMFTRTINNYFNNKGNKYKERSVYTFPYNPPTRQEFKSGFPYELVRIAIRTTTPPKDGTVLDMFAGTGTTAFVAKQEGRNSISIDMNSYKCYGIKARLGITTDSELIL